MKDSSVTRFLVLGCGYSGSTLISGLLNLNGFRTPKSTRDFESRELNQLCRQLLNGVVLREADIRAFFCELDRRTRGRWSLKSPQLAETIGRIYPSVGNPVKLIYNVRAPGPTIAHLLRSRRTYWPDAADTDRLSSAEDEWRRRNRCVIRFLDTVCNSPCLVTDYDEIVEGRMDSLLCRYVEKSLDLSFIEPRKRRSNVMPVSTDLEVLYADITRRRIANNRAVMRDYPPMEPASRSKLKLRARTMLVANRLVNAIHTQRCRLLNRTRVE